MDRRAVATGGVVTALGCVVLGLLEFGSGTLVFPPVLGGVAAGLSSRNYESEPFDAAAAVAGGAGFVVVLFVFTRGVLFPETAFQNFTRGNAMWTLFNGALVLPVTGVLGGIAGLVAVRLRGRLVEAG